MSNTVNASGVQRDVSLDLDKLEREGAPKPFTFVLNERIYRISDPQDVDWQDLIAATSNPYMFFKLVLSEEDRDAFFAQKIASWKMNKLMQRYQDHYGLPSAPNAVGLPR